MWGKTRSEELQDHHNKGEQDAASGEHHPPPAPGADRFVYGDDYADRELEDRAAYEQGHANTTNQNK